MGTEKKRIPSSSCECQNLRRECGWSVPDGEEASTAAAQWGRRQEQITWDRTGLSKDSGFYSEWACP